MTAAVVLASILSTLHLVPPANADQASDVDDPAVASAEPHVELDLSGLEPIDPGVRSEHAKAIHAALGEVIARSKVPPEKISVLVFWKNKDAIDYGVQVDIAAHDGVQPHAVLAATDPNATGEQLVVVLVAAVERALAEWRREHDKLAEVVDPPPPPPPDLPPPARARPLGRTGWAGVGLIVAGAVGIGIGGGLVGRDRTANPNDATRLQDWRYAGYSVLGIGALALVTGSALAIYDTRPKQRARRATVAPTGSRTGAGVVVRIRF